MIKAASLCFINVCVVSAIVALALSGCVAEQDAQQQNAKQNTKQSIGQISTDLSPRLRVEAVGMSDVALQLSGMVKVGVVDFSAATGGRGPCRVDGSQGLSDRGR